MTAGIFADGGYAARQKNIAHAADDSSELSSEAAKNEAAIEGQEEDIADLEKKQAELDAKIREAEGDISSEEEKQQAIREQISTVESTLHKLAGSIIELEASIDETQTAIAANEAAVEVKKQEIETGVSELKKRLRVMYIAGNDSYSQILVGASDFYDMLMKIELIRRVAAHDNDLLDGLIELKDQYEAEEETLSANKAKLETDLKDLENRRKKQQAQMTKLENLYAESGVTLESLAQDKALYEGNKEKIAKEQEEFEKQLAELLEERKRIAAEEEKKRKEEEERKAKEEEERKRKEEEERKAREEEEKKRREQEQQNDDSSQPESYDNDDGGSSDNNDNNNNNNNNDDNYNDNGDWVDPNDAYGYVPKSRFTWPVPGYYHISYGVGWRWGAYHKGIDIWSEGIRGHDIIAADSGTVILVSNTCTHDYGKTYSCGCGGGYGNYCIIDHGDGYWTLYGHSEKITVSQGQEVSKGDVLGTVGSTGHSTGAHLHFEVRIDGVAQDPQDYV